MRATGYVRKLDSLGRIVLPKSLRKELNINEGDDIEMYVDDDGNVVLDKYVPRCVFVILQRMMSSASRVRPSARIALRICDIYS